MSQPISSKNRVSIAYWSQLERWDAKAAQASVWQGSAHKLRPLAEALHRYRADVPRTDAALADWQLVTVRFDGSMEPRTAKVSPLLRASCLRPYLATSSIPRLMPAMGQSVLFRKACRMWQ